MSDRAVALHPDIKLKLERELAGFADLRPDQREHLRAAMLRLAHRVISVTTGAVREGR